jgi:hypothetical protein
MHIRQDTTGMAARMNCATLVAIGALLLFALPKQGFSQEQTEKPYFVTYTTQMEEVGSLDIEAETASGRPTGGNRFFGNLTELEYGIRSWWTAELYLDWQHTRHEGTLFTGFRIENRFRLVQGDHWFSPVLYVEYEHLNGADKTLKEITGFDRQQDLLVPNSEARLEREHEIEAKLIFSQVLGAWNLSENFIAEKNLSNEPWEFGYAVGLSRPLAEVSQGNHCVWCRSALSAGAEVYGGLGVWGHVTLHGTSHYLGPVIQWRLPGETALLFSPGIGLNSDSLGTLFRFGITKEFDLGRLFTHKP